MKYSNKNSDEAKSSRGVLRREKLKFQAALRYDAERGDRGTQTCSRTSPVPVGTGRPSPSPLFFQNHLSAVPSIPRSESKEYIKIYMQVVYLS